MATAGDLNSGPQSRLPILSLFFTHPTGRVSLERAGVTDRLPTMAWRVISAGPRITGKGKWITGGGKIRTTHSSNHPHLPVRKTTKTPKFAWARRGEVMERAGRRRHGLLR